MSETKQLRTMRVMAWQRAKGELYSMLETFWSDAENYDALDAEVNRFIKNVEDQGLQE